MKQLIRFVLTPVAFAVGFLLPLVVQILEQAHLEIDGWVVWVIAALILLPLTAMAHLRGSWIWIKP